jgi:hypothetical protein
MYQITKTIPIDSIIVENRRREDFGDVEGLAESIRRLGLFHPLVVDENNNLIAGERRLRACKMIGWREISVRYFTNLTDDEKNEIELEENARRKDLTPFEQSKSIVRLLQVATKVMQESKSEFSFIVNENLQGGRPQKAASLEKIAEKIGISQPTISRARTHVEAIEKYPELRVIAPMQKDAITIARNLDAKPEAEREESRKKLQEYDSETIGILAEKPPLRPREYALGESPNEMWNKSLQKFESFLSQVDGDGLGRLIRRWTQNERQAFYKWICQLESGFSRLKSDMEKILENEIEYDARKDVA